MTDPPSQLYAKHLLPFGYGYPLWTPEPSHELMEHRRDGLRIGDVGVIDLENGTFDVFFNICLPRDHPLHRATGVPDDFVPVKLDEWDVTSFPHAEHPGRVIATSSVTASMPEPTTTRSSTYDFSLSPNEGALLLLPKGAESYKLRKRQLFKDVAARNAVHWYNFAQQRLGHIIAHDALYLITGLCKTSAWSVASFHQDTGTVESPAQFKASQTGEGNSMAYTWETMRALDWRAGPQVDVGIPNQSVFVSGFKIAVRERMLGKRRVEVIADSPSIQSRSMKLSNGTGGLWRRQPRNNAVGNWKNTEQALPDTPGLSRARTTTSSTSRSGYKWQAAIHHPSQPLQSFHPSDILNRYLLSKEPSATVAITHDSQWGILFEKGMLKSEDLGDDGQLERVITENYRIISQEDAVCFQTICDSSIRLTNVDGAAHAAWTKDKLDDAEEILSRKLIRQTGFNYSALAHRALIRARLHHWDAALRDAEMSIDIQPSVVGHVAKGFALFGRGMYELAVTAFDVAIQQCDVRDKDVVLLVKSVVLFDVGYHAESMAGVADLVERCPVDARSACFSTQAEMCVRLAMTATKNKDYDRALQLLTRTQLREPFYAGPDLGIVSLISGWGFNDLSFTIHRQKCEVLYAAGRMDEAVELYLTTTRALEEDMRAKRDIAEWITAFAQQCLRVLESLGDNAMASQNYVEAISRYSMALSMSPPAREGFFIKRSKAYAAAHIWDRALQDAEEAINLNPVSPFSHERKYEVLQGMGRHDEAVGALNDMFSVLERSIDPQAQYLHSRYGQRLQVQGLNSPSHLSIHHALVTQITAIREQLGSDVATTERDQALGNQLNDVLNTISQLSPERGAISQEDEQNAARAVFPGEVPRTFVIQGQNTDQGLPSSRGTLPTSMYVPGRPVVHPSGDAPPPIIIRAPDGNARRSPASSGFSIPARRPTRPAPPGRVHSPSPVPFLRQPARRPSDDQILENTRRSGENDNPTDEPGDAQTHQSRFRYPSQPSSSNSNGPTDVIRPYSPKRPPYLIRHDTDGTLPDAGQTTAPGSELGSGTMSQDSQSDLRNLISTWQNIARGRGSVQNAQPCSRPDSSARSYRSSDEAPREHCHCRRTRARWPVATNTHVQPSCSMPAQPQVPLHDTLFEMLKEERIAHRASMNQQQEMTRQMRNHCEWLMKEMQDRLTELRGMIVRPNSYPQKHAEPAQPPLESHQGGAASIAPPAGPFSGPPWINPWYQHQPAFNGSQFGGGPFNAPSYMSVPFIPPAPSPVQPPYIPPEPILREYGTLYVPQRPGPSRGNDGRERAPLTGSSGHPPKTSAPTLTLTVPSEVPNPVSDPEPGPSYTLAQGTSKPSTLAPKSLLLGSESESPSVVGTVTQTPTSTSPFTTLSTRLRAPEYGSPKKSTSTLGDGEEGDKAANVKLGEKRRPVMVTFGDVTYIR